MDSPYSPPTSEQGNQKPHPLRKWIIIGCLGIIAIPTIIVTSCILGVRSSRESMHPVCTQYFQLLRENKYDEAYSQWGDDGKSSLSLENHRALVTDAFGKLGAIKKFEVQSVFSGVDQKGQWGRLIYKTDFEKTRGTITLRLRKYSGTYKITGIQIQMSHDYNSRPGSNAP